MAPRRRRRANRRTVMFSGLIAEVGTAAAIDRGMALGGDLIQSHVKRVGKVTLVEDDQPGGHRIWIRPPRPFMTEVVETGSAVERFAVRWGIPMIALDE